MFRCSQQIPPFQTLCCRDNELISRIPAGTPSRILPKIRIQQTRDVAQPEQEHDSKCVVGTLGLHGDYMYEVQLWWGRVGWVLHQSGVGIRTSPHLESLSVARVNINNVIHGQPLTCHLLICSTVSVHVDQYLESASQQYSMLFPNKRSPRSTAFGIVSPVGCCKKK